MSSTTNIQNLLVNVFRPSYQFRALPTPNYFVQLELSNVETVYANVVEAQNLRMSDANSNVYVGREAGNSYLELRDCFSNTTLGYGAGRAISNTDRGIYIGFNAGTNASNASNVIAIGTAASGRGTANIYIGKNTGGVDGEISNVYLGNDLSSSGSVSNRLWIGSGADPSGALISGNFATRRVGILTSNPTTYPVEIANYTYISNGLGINADPLDHTLNVNGDCRIEDGFGQFTFDRDEITQHSTMTFWSYTASKVGLVQIGRTSTSNQAFVGINTPGTSNGFNLDVSGTVRVRDLSGNTVTMQSNVVTSSGGYASIQGVTGSLSNGQTSNIGVWRRGLNMIAVLAAAAGPHSGSSWIYDGTTATNMVNDEANITITTSTSNIVLTNNSAGLTTFRFNITYFPTP